MSEKIHILAADIGGTNSRFGYFLLEDHILHLRQKIECLTSDIKSTEKALMVAAQTGLNVEQADIISFALAGPVSVTGTASLCASLINAPLRLDMRPLASQGKCVYLCNDFAAQAWASLTEPGAHTVPILPGMPEERGIRGFLGPGTGLGAASLLPNGEYQWMVHPSEMGHAPFAFCGQDEQDFKAYLTQKLKISYATWEHVLSGDGLVQLHAFLTGKEISAQCIAEQHLQSTTHTCSTARWFGRFLGRACKTWVLNTLCTGGLYITGGVVGKNPLLACNEDFAQEFYDAPSSMLPLLRYTAVWLMNDPLAGLWGAGRAGQAQLEISCGK